MILNIEGLVKALSLCKDKRGYFEVLRDMQISESELENFYAWNTEHYTRNCLVRTEDFEVVLICWEKGQQSYIHDYAANEAWIHPISGSLKEERFLWSEAEDTLHKVSSVTLNKGDYNYMSDKINIHRYTNVGENRTVSLHLYAKPVTEWNIYTEEGGFTGSKQVWLDNEFKLENA